VWVVGSQEAADTDAPPEFPGFAKGLWHVRTKAEHSGTVNPLDRIGEAPDIPPHWTVWEGLAMDWRRWPLIVGAVPLILEVWRWIDHALEWGEHVEFISHHSNKIKEVWAMIFAPPWWINMPLLIAGFAHMVGFKTTLSATGDAYQQCG
jgi:hypothetical protein